MSGGRIAQVFERVLYNTFNCNFMTIEVEQRQVSEVAKEERHSDRDSAQPIHYPWLVNRGERPDVFFLSAVLFVA